MRKLSFLLFSLSGIFCLGLNGQTPIPGGEVSGTWSIDGSPYLIQNTITVPNDATLIIEPGVVVEFQGSYTMYVNGCVLAMGTETDSILFTAADTNEGFNSIRYLATTNNNDTSRYEFCVFTYGKAHGPYPDNFGGALAALDFGKIIVENCRFAYNTAVWQTIVKPGGGAAIALLRSNMIIRNCIFEHNRGCIGGALMLSTDTALVENNVFRYNEAPYFSDDREGIGGAIFCKWRSHAIIRGNTIKNNNADVAGGAIFFWNYGNARLENNIICENNAGEYGGALVMDSCSAPFIINNTIANNSAAQRSGGININFNSDPDIYNTILWGNTANIGKQLYISSYDCTPNFYFSDIQGGQSAFGGIAFTGEYVNCIDSSPMFSQTGDHPYSLSEGSPCIDAGTPDTTGLCLCMYDIIRNCRIWDGDNNEDTIIDIGAYEFGSSGLGIADKNPFAIAKKTILYLYPNPAYGLLTIETNGVEIEQLTVYNIAGQEVIKVKQSERILDVSDLHPGLYIVEAVVEGRIVREKLVVE